ADPAATIAQCGKEDRRDSEQFARTPPGDGQQAWCPGAAPRDGAVEIADGDDRLPAIRRFDGRHSRDRAHTASASQERIAPPRARTIAACAMRVAWKANDSAVQRAMATRPMSGRPKAAAAVRIARFGLRRAVMARK